MEFYEVQIRVDLPCGVKVREEIKEMKNDLERLKVPKKGFWTNHKKNREILKIKKMRRAYEQMIDCHQLLKYYKGKRSSINIYYDQDSPKSKKSSYVIFCFYFTRKECAKAYQKNLSELYPECIK